MTAQIEDVLVVDGLDYALKTSLDALISPGNWGISPRPMHTACWRGFHVQIAVRDRVLMLMSMTVASAAETFPAIQDLMPEVSSSGVATYRDLCLRLPYTGTLTAARDFDRRHYQHMGFHPLSAYGTILTLRVEDGEVVAQELRTQDTSKTQLDVPPLPPPPLDPCASPATAGADQGLLTWIRRRFLRDE